MTTWLPGLKDSLEACSPAPARKVLNHCAQENGGGEPKVQRALKFWWERPQNLHLFHIWLPPSKRTSGLALEEPSASHISIPFPPGEQKHEWPSGRSCLRPGSLGD